MDIVLTGIALVFGIVSASLLLQSLLVRNTRHTPPADSSAYVNRWARGRVEPLRSTRMLTWKRDRSDGCPGTDSRSGRDRKLGHLQVALRVARTSARHAPRSRSRSSQRV